MARIEADRGEDILLWVCHQLTRFYSYMDAETIICQM